MEYNVADLKREIRVVLDQNMNSTALSALGDVDTLSLEEIIESKIEDAAFTIEARAPLTMLDSGDDFSDTIEWEEDRTTAIGGSLALPSDFMRLISFKMSDWDYAVNEAITEDDPLYHQQKSRYGGVRGNPQKPVVAITMQESGLVLEFYSCQSDEATIDRARYLSLPKIATNKIDLCEKLKRAIVYYAAYLVALSVSDGNLATTLLVTARELAGLTTNE